MSFGSIKTKKSINKFDYDQRAMNVFFSLKNESKVSIAQAVLQNCIKAVENTNESIGKDISAKMLHVRI